MKAFSDNLAQENGFLQAVLHFGVLQVGFEVLAFIAGAVSNVLQVIGGPGADDVVCQQDAAFPQEATLLRHIQTDTLGQNSSNK